MSTAALELTGVTKRFSEDLTAVDNVTFSVADGEFFSLLGPSGCGKTTTLRMISGLETPDEGSITIFGEVMTERPPHLRPVNTVFQSYALFPHMTVFENVSYGLKVAGLPNTEIEHRSLEAIEMVQLHGLDQRNPNQLSGGQQQRVALARALVNRPKLLLLDEPLGALDLQLRQEMQIELKDLQRDLGITFVYVTHDQGEALTMSDRIAVMNRGRLLQVGSPEEIYESPADRFVADFIGETNLVRGRVVTAGRVDIGDGREIGVRSAIHPEEIVILALRPEMIRLARPGADVGDSYSTLEGRVSRRIYFGEVYQYRVDVGDLSFDVRVANRPGVDDFLEGDDVRLDIHPDAAQLLSE